MIYIDTDIVHNTWYSDIKDSYVNTGNTAFVMKIYNPLHRETKDLYIYDGSSTTDKNIFTIHITHTPSQESGITSTLYLDNWLGQNDYKIYYISGTTDGNYNPSEIYLIDSGILYIYNEHVNLNHVGYDPNITVSFTNTGFTYL